MNFYLKWYSCEQNLTNFGQEFVLEWQHFVIVFTAVLQLRYVLSAIFFMKHEVLKTLGSMAWPRLREIRSCRHLESLGVPKRGLHCRRNTRKWGQMGKKVHGVEYESCAIHRWLASNFRWPTQLGKGLDLQRRQESSFVSTTTRRLRPNDSGCDIFDDTSVCPIRVSECVELTSKTYCELLDSVLLTWLEELPLLSRRTAFGAYYRQGYYMCFSFSGY